MKRRSRLTPAARNSICHAVRLRKTLRDKELAKRFGCSTQLVQSIANGRR